MYSKPEAHMGAPNVTVTQSLVTPAPLPGERTITGVSHQPGMSPEQQLLSTLHSSNPQEKQIAVSYLKQHPEMGMRVMSMARQQQRENAIPPEIMPHNPTPIGAGTPYAQPSMGVTPIQQHPNPMVMQQRMQPSMGAYHPAMQHQQATQMVRVVPHQATYPVHPQTYRMNPMQHPQRMMAPQSQMYQTAGPVHQHQQQHPSQLQQMLSTRQPTQQYPSHQNVYTPHMAGHPSVHTMGPPPQYPSNPMRHPMPQTAGYPQVLGQQTRTIPVSSSMVHHMSPSMQHHAHAQYGHAPMAMDPGMQSDPSFLYHQQPQYGLNSSNNNNSLSQDFHIELTQQDRLSRLVEHL